MRLYIWRYALALAVCLSLVRGLLAAPSMGSSEELISTLVKVPFGAVYYDDGAGDGSVTDKEWITSLAGEKAYDPIQSILALKQRAIPLLIEHLDDQQLTLATFDGKPVPLGHLALDILIHIAANGRVLIPDCADDGLGACYEPAFYFRPDANAEEMRNVKAHWRRLYRKGVLKFTNPPW